MQPPLRQVRSQIESRELSAAVPPLCYASQARGYALAKQLAACSCARRTSEHVSLVSEGLVSEIYSSSPELTLRMKVDAPPLMRG